MADTSDMATIEKLKQTLNNTLIINNFNLQHPNVLRLSHKLNVLLIPHFRSQIPQPKAKVIKFPVK